MGVGMKHDIEPPECLPGESQEIHITIIYEDFASGLRAKHFAERLAGQLACSCELTESFWRSDLLDCPPVATEAARLAADCDYLIVALRGDHVVPWSTRRWIESQLDGAARRGAALVILPDSSEGKRPVVEATRHHFRTVCAAKGVAFYSHAMTVLPNVALSVFFPNAGSSESNAPAPRWSPGWTAAESQNYHAHDLLARK